MQNHIKNLPHPSKSILGMPKIKQLIVITHEKIDDKLNWNYWQIESSFWMKHKRLTKSIV